MRNARNLWPLKRGWTGGFLDSVAWAQAALAVKRKRAATACRLVKNAAYRSHEDAVGGDTGDQIAGATGSNRISPDSTCLLVAEPLSA